MVWSVVAISVRQDIGSLFSGDFPKTTIIYTAPFDRCDREADYRTAWTEFEKRERK